MKILSKTALKNLLYSSALGRKAAHSFYSRTNPLFESVELETSSICNRKCSYCPVAYQKRPGAYMAEEVFRKIIGDLEAIGYSGVLSFAMYSEPLLDKRFADLVGYAKSALPHAFIEVYSNGDFLTPELFEKLVKAGMGVIKVTQHVPGPSPEFLETMDAIRRLKDGNKLHFSVMSEDQELFNRGGAVTVKNQNKMQFCNLRRMYINYKGEVLLCCMDYYAKNILGDATKENIVAIWQKSGYKAIRDNVKSGIWPLEICRTCTGNPEKKDAATNDG